MKLLQLHAEFKLPDDFDGTLPEALRRLADYWESPDANAREPLNRDHPDWISSKAVCVGDWESNALQRLIEKNQANGTRVVICHFLGDWSS
jgi:hypothetical protein